MQSGSGDHPLSGGPTPPRRVTPFTAVMMVYALVALALGTSIVVQIVKKARALYIPPSSQLAAVLLGGPETNGVSGSAQDLKPESTGE
jgi:hypothetical protein